MAKRKRKQRLPGGLTDGEVKQRLIELARVREEAALRRGFAIVRNIINSRPVILK